MLRVILILSMFLLGDNVFANVTKEQDCQNGLLYIDMSTFDPFNPSAMSVNSTVEPDPANLGDDNWFIQKDSVGVRGTCRDKFNTLNARMTIQRTTTDPFTAKYKVSYAYCIARNIDGGCAGSNWQDKSSKTLDYADVGTYDESSGRKTLGPTWVCLKRYAPGETMRHKDESASNLNKTIVNGVSTVSGSSDVNNTKFTKVCAYSVLANCNDPVVSWQHDWFGCVDVPFMPRPVTYNKVIPSEISPVVDPRVKLDDYTDASGTIVSGYITMRSVFDQPLIKLINAYDGRPDHQLILRYKFPGDTDVRQFNDYPSSGSFPGKTTVYQTVIDSNDPSKVCACKQSECVNKIYVGCADRPTPYQSNLAVMAVYQSQTDSGGNTLFDANGLEIPTVSPEFAITDAAHQIIYYDQDGTKVYIDPVTKNAFKTDAAGVATTTPANGKITYKKLALPAAHMQIREYYPLQVGSNYTYTRDVKNVYAIDFAAMIPSLDSAGNPLYKRLDLYPYREDRCKIVTEASSQNDASKPLYFVPSPQRIRTYCACPSPDVCPAPLQDDTCNGPGGTTQYSNADALKIYCPGLFTGSELDTSDKICLVNMSGWDFTSSVDSMCTKIAMGCPATEVEFKTGYISWPYMKSGTTKTGQCYLYDDWVHWTFMFDFPAVPGGLPNQASKFTKAQFYAKYSCTSDAQILSTGVTCASYYSTYQTEWTNFYTAVQNWQTQHPERAPTLNVNRLFLNTLGTNLMPTFWSIHRSISDSAHYVLDPQYTGITPSRTCLNGVATVNSPCQKVAECKAITQPLKAYGYAIFPKLDTAYFTASDKHPWIVTGSCPAGYTQITSSVNLTCDYDAAADAFYWVDVAQPMCRKN